MMREPRAIKRQKITGSDTWLDIVSGKIPDGVVHKLKYMHVRSAQQQVLMAHIRRANHWRQYRNVMVHLMCCRARDKNFYHERDVEDDNDDDIIFEGHSHLYHWPDADRSSIMQSDAKGVTWAYVRSGGYENAFPRRVFNGKPKLCRWFSHPFYTD